MDSLSHYIGNEYKSYFREARALFQECVWISIVRLEVLVELSTEVHIVFRGQWTIVHRYLKVNLDETPKQQQHREETIREAVREADYVSQLL